MLYDDKEYEVIRSALNDTKDKVVLLCLNIDLPNSNHDVFWEDVNCIEPLDYKSPKQILLDKALDLAAQNMSFEVFIERLYENGLLRNPE